MKTTSLEKTINGNFVVKSLLTVAVIKNGREATQTETLSQFVVKTEAEAVKKLSFLGVKVDDALFALELFDKEGSDFASFGMMGGLVTCGDKEDVKGTA